MKIVYIAHPISGDVEGNLAKIRRIARNINLRCPKIVPFVPYYVDIVSLDDTVPSERERGIANDVALFHKGCIDEVWVFGDRISNGIAAEIKLAQQLNIPVLMKKGEYE